VQILVDEGRITAEEASVHPQRSLITKAMDGRDAEPEYSIRQVLPGDRYLICSDGLSSVVSADTIAQSLREYADPAQCVERLLALALRGGGPDNITIVVADATDGNIMEQAPVVGGAASPLTIEKPEPAEVESTPAARASALNPPRPAVQDVELATPAAKPRRHPVRAALILVTLLLLLGGGLYGIWAWSQSQYYIGATDAGQVAIFSGVPGQLAGFSLSEVQEVSAVRLDQLTLVAQEKVRQGIPAKDLADAQVRLNELVRDDPANLLPRCPTPTPSVATAASPSPEPTPSEPAVLPTQVPCRSN
jgi:protein phosphatase